MEGNRGLVEDMGRVSEKSDVRILYNNQSVSFDDQKPEHVVKEEIRERWGKIRGRQGKKKNRE